MEWSGGRSAPSCTISHGFTAFQLLQECPDLIQRAALCHGPGAELALLVPFPAVEKAAWNWDDGWEILQRRAWFWSSWRLSKPGFAVGQVFHLFGCFSRLWAVCCVYFGGKVSPLENALGEKHPWRQPSFQQHMAKLRDFPFSGRHRRYFGLRAVALKKPTQ